MAFLNGWALGIGAAAIALPLVVHWLTRPRPRRLALSTIRFIQEAVKQRRARHRLRDILVLALRGLAVALLALAFARPMSEAGPMPAPSDDAGEARVVIVDVSASMSSVSHGIALIERARPAAARFLTYRPGLHCNLILAGAAPHAIFDRTSPNLAALAEELGKSQALPERLNVGAALALAADMLAPSPANPQQRHELVIVSDFQRTNWANVDFSVLPKDTVIQLESVAPAQPLDNLAVTGVTVAGRAEVNREARVEVEVANFTATARTVPVEITVGGVTSRLEKLCPAQAKTTFVTGMVFPTVGWQAGQARLVDVDDALAWDNVRPLAVQVRPPLSFLLLTREPASPRPSSSQFLERALAPMSPRADSAQHMVRLDPAQFDRDALGNADLVVLDHPGKLSPAAAGLLAASLRRGKSILYAAGEPVDATNLKLLSDAAGSDLTLPVEFLPPAFDKPRRDLFLAELKRNDPPFAVFGENLSAVISPLRFSGGMATRRLPQGLSDDVLATYSDQSACLVVTACGSGSLAVFNADLGSSNLAGSPAFVPLIGELTARLQDKGSSASSATCGQALAMLLPPEAESVADLKLEGPTSGADVGHLMADNGTVVWRWPRVGEPGIYRVMRGKQTVQAIAAGLPAEEADLATLDPQMLQSRLSGGRTVYSHNAALSEQSHDDRWVQLALAAMACVLAEIVVLRVFRS